MNSMQNINNNQSIDNSFPNRTNGNSILDLRPMPLTIAELLLRNSFSGCYDAFLITEKYRYLESLCRASNKVPSTRAASSNTLNTESTEGIHLTRSLDASQDHAVSPLLYDPSISNDTLRFLIQNEKKKRIVELNERNRSIKLDVVTESLNYLASVEMQQRRQGRLGDILLQDLQQTHLDKQTNFTTGEDLRATEVCISLQNCKEEVDRICHDYGVIVTSFDSSGTEYETRCNNLPSYQTNKLIQKSKSFTKADKSQERLKCQTIFRQTQSALHSDYAYKPTSNATYTLPVKTNATDSVQDLDIITSGSDLKSQDDGKISWTQSVNSKSNDGQAISLKQEEGFVRSDKEFSKKFMRCNTDLGYGKGAMQVDKEYTRSSLKPKKAKRPSNMPRRPLSAYNFFFSEERRRILQSILNEHPRTTEICLKPLGRSCDQITNLAISSVKDKKLSDIHTESTSLLNTERLLSLGHTTRYVRRPHRKTHGKIGFKALAKLIGERWRSLPQTKKHYYQSLASIDLKRYKDQMAAYNAKKKVPHSETTLSKRN